MAEIDPFRTRKSYSIAEAARYANVSAPTVRRWIYGDGRPGRAMAPVFGDKVPSDGSALEISFLDLAELSVAATFTKRGGKLQKVRAARERARHDHPDLRYPFASLRLKQIGGEILHATDEEMGGPPLAISLGGFEGEQYVLPAFADQALDLFDFDGDLLASRWFPAGREVPLVIDPHVAGGRLTIVGRGVTADTVRGRLHAGEDWEFVAEDLEVPLSAIHAAMEYLTRKAA